MMPECVADPATDYHNVVIYTYPFEKPSRFEAMGDTLRDLVNRSESRLRNAGGDNGADRGYLFSCEAPNMISITAEGLTTLSRDTTFGTIVNELRQRGYTSAYAKYWVWYDGGVGGFGGQATLSGDDRLTVNNANNRGGSFAITYGQTGSAGVRVLMHENGHNLGAVQNSAPHSSGGGHCNDGLDIMCYADDGYKSAYTTTSCGGEAFDCNYDDYFNPDPAPGAYLATHWNLGSTLNRFFSNGPRPPVFAYAYCTPQPVEPNVDATCQFRAYDAGPLNYIIDWGDGSPLESQWTPTGNPATLTHNWSALGLYNGTVTATDSGTPPLSATRAMTFNVRCALLETGRLLVGLKGVETTYSAVDKTVKAGCDGDAYSLTGPDLSNFDVCWYDAASVLLSCDKNEGNEAGIIPIGSATARIILVDGVNANYRLQAA